VIGSGRELAAWKQRAAQAQMSDSMHFLGHRRDVPDLVRASDFLVSPTRYEAYGLGVHEALCCGIPALVTDDAGVAERYPPDLQELLIRNPDDASELSKQLKSVFNRSLDLRESCLQFAEQLRERSWNDMAAELVERLEDSTIASPAAPERTSG
jgi:glycosyltransferase involved in cell wall biosynthesis